MIRRGVYLRKTAFTPSHTRERILVVWAKGSRGRKEARPLVSLPLDDSMKTPYKYYDEVTVKPLLTQYDYVLPDKFLRPCGGTSKYFGDSHDS